jgi:hypothetical protein
MNSAALKGKNSYRLGLVLLANIVLFLVLRNYFSISEIVQLLDSASWRNLVSAVIPSMVFGIVVSLFGGILGDLQKARLIFWKWSDPLPGSRAFSVHAEQDPRVELSQLKQVVVPWPVSPSEQNAAWYRLYKSVSSDPVVVMQHKEYLFMRDWACMAALAVPFVAAALWYLQTPTPVLLWMAGALTAQYVVVRIAAKNYALRFVTAVLSVVSSGASSAQRLRQQ